MPEPKTVLITGGTRRLGKAIATHYAVKGWRLVLGYLNDEAAAEQSRRELEQSGATVRIMRCDTASSAQVEALVGSVRDQEQRLDFLLHNVGHYKPMPAVDVKPEDWDQTIGANLNGGFYCAHFARDLLRDSQGLLGYMGYSGLHALRADPDTLDYQVSKIGLLSLVKTLAVAYGPLGIRVAMVSPGQMDNSVDLPDSKSVIPLRRWGATADLCEAWDYLLGASYVTGVNIDVAGGFRL